VTIGTPPYTVVPNFAVFIDTHRDQPHVPTFEDDIHRGMSRPTMVHYAPPPAGSPPEDLGTLIRVEDGKAIPVDPKHRFVEVDWWSEFLTEYVMDHGVSPVASTGETKGQLPTSHLRNARTKVYKLKSLRQVVRAWEKASVATTGTPFKARTKSTVKSAVATALAAALSGPPLPAATAAAKRAAKAALGLAPIAPKKEPYDGPIVTDHKFWSTDDDHPCIFLLRASGGVTMCGVPKEGHSV
jgi:hypothetical protein